MTVIIRHILRLFILVLILVVVEACGGGWLVGRESQDVTKDPEKAVPNKILDDDMGTTIKIGVDAAVTEEQLRATLVRAANDHQDDPARDYLTSMFLWVEAYLVRNGDQSSLPAGRIKRYLPPGNPDERRRMTTDRTKDDILTITLAEAKESLP